MKAEDFAGLLRYEAHTGNFVWLVRRNGRAGGVRPGDIAGKTLKTGYISIGVNGKDWLAHRLAVLFMTGEWPVGDVDHIDGDPANNRWDNLRDVPHSINLQNRRKATKASKSGVLGVHYSTTERRWIAEICVQGKAKRIGRFKTVDDASDAYKRVKRLLHAGCTI